MRFSLLGSSRSSTACLALNIKTLRERKERLRQPLSRTGPPLQFSDHQIGRGSGVLRRGLVSCRWRASSSSAWMRPTRPAIAAFRSTSNARTGQATIAVGISRRTSPDLSLSVIEIALRNGSALRCMGTCVVALAMVAEGSIDAYYEATMGLPGRNYDRARGERSDERGSRSPDACARWTIARQRRRYSTVWWRRRRLNWTSPKQAKPRDSRGSPEC